MLAAGYRTFVTAVWAAIVLVGVYYVLIRPDVLRDGMLNLSSSSEVLASVAFLVMGCLRGFTLIPVTYLMPFGLLVLDPLVMFVLTMGGIVVSSASLYYFSERLQLAEYFEARHPRHVERIRRLLERSELPIVIAWSFFPFVPTDLICYVCGSLGIDVRKLILGVLVGEGIICAIYIVLGRQLLASIL